MRFFSYLVQTSFFQWFFIWTYFTLDLSCWIKFNPCHGICNPSYSWPFSFTFKQNWFLFLSHVFFNLFFYPLAPFLTFSGYFWPLAYFFIAQIKYHSQIYSIFRLLSLCSFLYFSQYPQHCDALNILDNFLLVFTLSLLLACAFISTYPLLILHIDHS